METIGVQLGRFAPYHNGHHMITEAIIAKHGADHTLVMIGSSTSLNERTPFTFEQRREMIQKAVGNLVEIMPLPDTDPTQSVPYEDSFAEWRKGIKAIEQARQVQFKFYGGSREDLRIFGDDFPTEVIRDRATAGKGISATAIREQLKAQDITALREVMDERIIADAIHYFHQNIQSLTHL